MIMGMNFRLRGLTMTQLSARFRNQFYKASVILLCVPLFSHFAHTQECPELQVHSAGLDADIEVPKSMYRLSWPQNVKVYQRVLISRVTPFLDNQSAKKGTEILNTSVLNLPTTARIIDVNVRVRAVQKGPAAARAPVLELGTWHPRRRRDASEACRLAEYGIALNELDSIPYPVIGAGESRTINWSNWIPNGEAHVTLSNNSVVLFFDPIEGSWSHRFFWDAVVYYSPE
jgi:hypothetical protein